MQVKCYICEKEIPSNKAQHVGHNIYRCKKHTGKKFFEAIANKRLTVKQITEDIDRMETELTIMKLNGGILVPTREN
jgi:hypothetical protein